MDVLVKVVLDEHYLEHPGREMGPAPCMDSNAKAKFSSSRI